MGLRVEPHPEGRWIRLRVQGTLDAARLEGLREQVVLRDSARDGPGRTLARSSDPRREERRTVVVASRPARGTSRLAAGTTGATEETAGVFQDVEEAEAWLAADAG